MPVLKVCYSSYCLWFAEIDPALKLNIVNFSVDKKNQLDVTFCILYFCSNSCSTCFGQPSGADDC